MIRHLRYSALKLAPLVLFNLSRVVRVGFETKAASRGPASWTRTRGVSVRYLFSMSMTGTGQEGKKAPAFSGKDQNGNMINSEDFYGKQNLVVFFYPKDFSAICTKEACSFRDNSEDFKKLDATIIGISSDSESTHKEFAEKNSLNFPILSDADGSLRKAFQTPTNLFGLLPGRVTYVINKEGTIVKEFQNAMGAGVHVEEAKAALKA